mmetsp:Transcript_86171/g.248837  ORF Transcript_86171/g.248837 Transcript_86171/m.248837 type:complete len:248 (-) Transcript_86171:135-878(-)|eukprot:CAMPEP_0176132642 /NCGR_PEP_ID=MMETSP0120_2-20121206/67200_1 /TAXON_ID=160619 /ORGANISM="Kryptoperidinium foliaceum, Strain CCMP 1326" /LENGTH=247 /DNA_ID=CAMNT_0017468133 /DNA_START=69 /DNA_END=812 /DNA_ORIENTATION=-
MAVSSSTTTAVPASPLRPTPKKNNSGLNTPNRPRLGSNGGGTMHAAATPNTPNRQRVNSRDIPRSYSGMYGQADGDLLPFELARNWHTDWLERPEFLLLYVVGIVLVQFLVLATMDTFVGRDVVPLFWSWTVTNAIHCLVSLICLHWSKGSYFDDQGEMAAMTLWEQLEGRPKTVHIKRFLTIVPTLLCYAACSFSNYEYNACVINGILWTIHVLAKLPVMNGVRIFGINRTTGIDDEYDVLRAKDD